MSSANSSNGTEIVAVKSVDPRSIEEDLNRPESMPFGLLDFTLRVANPGDETTVTVYLSQAVVENAKWYKYDQANGWQDYSAHASFSSDGSTVTIELKDGGYGDSDGIVNGIIVDPSGPGFTSLPVSAGDSDCFIVIAGAGSPNLRGGIFAAVLFAGIGLIWCLFSTRRDDRSRSCR